MRVTKSVLCIVALAVLAAVPCAATTEVGGTISTNTVWALANSPYEAISDVTVNATLTVEPGVQVFFRPGTRMVVNGRLTAVGTSGSPIHFGSTRELEEPSTAAPADWNGVFFAGESASEMTHCAVAYATTGVYLSDDHPGTVSNCTFTANSSYPISVSCHDIKGMIRDNSGSGNVAGDLIEARGGHVSDSNQIWKPNQMPYRVTGDDVTVWGFGGNAKLTIDAGTVVQFSSNTGLQVGADSNNGGSLVCSGTGGAEVVLTAASGVPGGWLGIRSYYAGVNLSHCRIECAGERNQAICNDSWSHLVMTNCTVSDCASNGVYAVEECTTEISNCAFLRNNGVPIDVFWTEASYISGNTGSGNGQDVISLRSRSDCTGSAHWHCNALPYRVTGADVNVLSSGGATLTVDPGTVVKFAHGCGLNVGTSSGPPWTGTLNCDAFGGPQIVFTAESGTPGGWKGIRFLAHSGTQGEGMRNCRIEYAAGANIACEWSEPRLTDCVITQSTGYGVYGYDNSTPHLERCTITNNAQYPISVHCNGAEGLKDNQGEGNGAGDLIEVRGSGLGEDPTWHANPLPYLIRENIRLEGGYYPGLARVLTIDPGVVMKFCEGAGFTVGRVGANSYNGALVCNGTEQNPIVMTSGPGDTTHWAGVYMDYPTDDSRTRLTHCHISRTAGGAVYVRDGVTPTIEDCEFRDNAGYPISIHCNNASRISGNSGTGNGQGDMIYLRPGNVSTTQTWHANAMPYLAGASLEVHGPANQPDKAVSLTIEAGTEIRFPLAAGLSVGKVFPNNQGLGYGSLVCAGLYDSEIKLDCIPLSGQRWEGVSLIDLTGLRESDITHTRIQNCHYGVRATNVALNMTGATVDSCYFSGVDVTGGSARIRRCKVSNSGGNSIEDAGIRIRGCAATVDSSVIRCSMGVRTTDAAVDIINNTFHGCGIAVRVEDPAGASRVSNNIVTSSYGTAMMVDQYVEMLCNCYYGNYSNFESSSSGFHSGPSQYDVLADPLYVNAAAGDFHLRVNSPCINAGSNGSAIREDADIDGDTRVLPEGSVVDIGADEYATEPVFTPPEIGGKPDGTQVTLVGPGEMVTSAKFADLSMAYLQTTQRTMGIQVLGTNLEAPGTGAIYKGTLDTVNGERVLRDAVALSATEYDPPLLPRPLDMSIAAVGGGPSALQPGITGAWGVCNIGLLVRTQGRVVSVGSSRFAISDGSGIILSVLTPPGVILPAMDSFVAVTGVSSCEQPGGQTVRLIRARSQDDITVYTRP